MGKRLTTHVQRKIAEREHLGARRTLSHLVEIYDSGQWRRLYREDVFAATVRQAREVFDHWTDVLNKCDRGFVSRSRLLPKLATRGRNRPAQKGGE